MTMGSEIESVFLSSTFTELTEYRDRATEAILAAGYRCVRMEDFVAGDELRQKSDDDRVLECQIFVLILGKWYGSLGPDGKTSYTELEFATAKNAGLKILPFILAMGAPKNDDAALARLEAENLNLNEQRSALKAFTKKVSTGMSPREVKDPADLKFWLGLSLRTAPAPPPPKVNSMLVHLCDRGPQMDEFSNVFNTAEQGLVQLYVLYGPERQQHASCIGRLICYHVLKQHPADELPQLAPALPDRRIVEWPSRRVDSAEIVFNRVRRDLFRALEPGHTFTRGDDATAFCELAVSVRTPHLVFRHIVDELEFDGTAQQCVQAYLRFWDEVAAKAKALAYAFRVIVFFEIVGSLEIRPQLDSIFLAPRPGAHPACRTSVLPGLEDVTRSELRAWIERFGRHIKAPHDALGVDEIFPVTPAPMREVQRKLKEIVGL
jgi:hypothetical protein